MEGKLGIEEKCCSHDTEIRKYFKTLKSVVQLWHLQSKSYEEIVCKKSKSYCELDYIYIYMFTLYNLLWQSE